MSRSSDVPVVIWVAYHKRMGTENNEISMNFTYHDEVNSQNWQTRRTKNFVPSADTHVSV